MSNPGGSEVAFVNVRRRFGNVIAVDDVTLSVAPGEFFTLLGPSGSGKTTLLQILAGFQEPDSGQVVLDGKPMMGVPPAQRGIGVVFQSYALFPNMNVFENVAFPLRVRHVGKSEILQRVDDALGMVQLRGLETRNPGQLSGGQQQRVAFARAMVFEPRLLLMDEPLSALDAKLRRAMRTEMKELQRKLGVTVIYVTHDQEEALAMSDRIALMNRGNIEQIDTPDRIYSEPRSTFVADFLGEANLIEGTVTRQTTLAETQVTACGVTFTVHARSPFAAGTRVMICVRPERILVHPPSGVPNLAAGRVEASVYGGDHFLLRMRAAGGFPINVKLPAGASDGIARVGAEITVGWTADCGVALPFPFQQEKL